MNYNEALSYINHAVTFGSKPGLERIKVLCEMLGNPQDNIRFVHIAGTNGKGSVCAMLSGIFQSAGLKTGLFTSPHIEFLEERIKIDGKPIYKNRLAEIIGRIKSCTENMADKPTEFEIFTAAAFLYFFEENCDIVVLETGLGGRLDSTNIIKSPLLSVITGIDLDHTGILGPTLKEIANEKAGIIKKNCPVLIGDCPYEARQVLLKKAKEKKAHIFIADSGIIRDIKCSVFGSKFSALPYGEISLSLAGFHQIKNAAVAITAAQVLKNRGLPIENKDIIKGLSSAENPARFELLDPDEKIIYDGAHNPQGAKALAENIKKLLGEKVVLVMGVMADKDYKSMAKTLSAVADCVFTVKPQSNRALKADILAEVFKTFSVKAESSGSPTSGVLKAIKTAKEKKLPLIICGSLYMYGEILSAVKEEKENQT